MAEEGTALQGLNALEDEGRKGDGGTSSKTVEVKGISLDTSPDLLEMYFENTRRSGGGDIEEIEIKDDVAYITFEEAEVVQRVVSNNPHQVAGQTLTVTLFCPPLQKPSYKNRVLIQRLNSAVTEELLTNFLERETGMKVVEYLYGEEEGKVVVTFSNIIDFAALKKACSKRRLEGTFIQVTKVAISNCILVKNLQPAASNEFILFYFENKRSGGGDIDRVDMNTAERYCRVYFVDHNVIDTVLCQQHKIDGADIEVYLHHECLGRRSSRSRLDPFLGMSKPEMKDILKAETSSSVSSNTDKGCDYVETPKWQEDDGKNCVLPFWIKYKRASERTIIKNIKEIPCSWNFHVFWNFYTKTKQGQQMLGDILKKCGCSVTVSSDDDDLFIFEISDKRFQKESEVIDFIKDTMNDVYACAQQSLFSDVLLIDHRMLEDILQRVKQTKEMDCAWIELVGEQEPDAICVVCTEKDKVSILQVVTAIKIAVQDCFENHEDVVTIDPMWQKVLKKFGYLHEISEKFPNLTMTPDKTKATITLRGARDQSNAAARHLMELLGTAHADVQEDIFTPGCQFDIFTYPEMYDYINNSIKKLPFVWIPNRQTMRIHLFFKKSEQIMGMDKFIKGCIKERPYPLTRDQSVCCPKIVSSLEELKKKHKGKIVINQSPTGIILTTADDIFESVNAVVEEIISIETGKVQPAHVPEKHVKRDGQLVNKSEYKASENQEKAEDSLQRKKDVSSEKKTNTGTSAVLKSVPDVSFDQLEVMTQPDIKVKPFSDGIAKLEDRTNSGPISTRIRVIVQKGQLHEAQTEVLVTTVNRNLDLTKGAISSSLLLRSGSGIQKELHACVLMKGKIPLGQVLKTGVGSLPLPYRAIFHGALYVYEEHPESLKVFKNFLLGCLEEANKKYRSIAFPPIGTGRLGYPKDLVASLMFESVAEFECSHPTTKLKEVKFVIYEKDKETLKEFEMMYIRCFGASLERVVGIHATEAQGASPRLLKKVRPQNITVKPMSPLSDALSKEDCPICLEEVKSPKTLSCGHTFCIKCIEKQFRTKPVCPKCGTFHGTIYVDQPEGGNMSISIKKYSLTGFAKSDTLKIEYHIPSGYQGPDCLKPGKFYEGIKRTAYLPDTVEGRKVCDLLKVAFHRRLVFKLGRSNLGVDGVLVWNDIHHKTELFGENGYPDHGYLKRVQEQLAAKGVTEADLQI